MTALSVVTPLTLSSFERLFVGTSSKLVSGPLSAPCDSGSVPLTNYKLLIIKYLVDAGSELNQRNMSSCNLQTHYLLYELMVDMSHPQLLDGHTPLHIQCVCASYSLCYTTTTTTTNSWGLAVLQRLSNMQLHTVILYLTYYFFPLCHNFLQVRPRLGLQLDSNCPCRYHNTTITTPTELFEFVKMPFAL